MQMGSNTAVWRTLPHESHTYTLCFGAKAHAHKHLMLKLDLAKALSDGYQFWRSSNGVVLAEGQIPLKLLSPVTAEQLL